MFQVACRGKLEMTRPLVLIGGGGHCKACIDVVDLHGVFDIVGIVDKPERFGEKVLGYSVIATDAEMLEVKKMAIHCLITIGQIGTAKRRRELFKELLGLGFTFPVVVSPRAYVSARASVGEGSVIMHGAVINAGARIGVNSIINSQALVEHDVRIGDHCHVATGAIVNGDSVVGDGTFVGSNAVIFQGVSVGRDAVVGGGQVIRRSLPDGYHPGKGKENE